MGLRRVKLGELITQRREKYNGENLPAYGVSSDGFIPPKQKVADKSLYNVFYKDDFVFNPARMELNSIAHNRDYEKAICSSLYEIFYINQPTILLSSYLDIFVKRAEFARLCKFIGWGSAREYCRITNISDIEIELPPIEVQRKYVAIYEAMLENQRSYERGLDDLKLACDGYIEELMHNNPLQSIAPLIERHDVRNTDKVIKSVKGVSTAKVFKEPTSKVDRNNLENYKIVRPRQFSFVQTTHNEKCFAYAFNDSSESIVVTSVNEVFSTNEAKLLPEYLAMFFSRKEFDRYARFHSWGSARETFTWQNLQDVEIPIPDNETQQAIANIYKVYRERTVINERLKAQLKDICPVLIKGSLEEVGS